MRSLFLKFELKATDILMFIELTIKRQLKEKKKLYGMDKNL